MTDRLVEVKDKRGNKECPELAVMIKLLEVREGKNPEGQIISLTEKEAIALQAGLKSILKKAGPIEK